MKQRRSLVEGLDATPELTDDEREFVYGKEKATNAAQPQTAQPIEIKQPGGSISNQTEPRVLPQMTGRIPVTTRCKPEVATALKRASLQRQLAGTEPFYVQDIMEEALESWLSDKGYI